MKTRIATLLLAISALAWGQSAGLTTVTVGSGATPTLTVNAGYTTFIWTLTGNVTSSTFSSAAVGAGSLILCEDATGGRTVVFPANFVGFKALQSTAANYCQTYTWEYDGTNVTQTGYAGAFVRSLGAHFDGGGSALSGTQTQCLRTPFGGTIIGWRADGNTSGSATFAVRSVAFGSYTGTAGFSGYTDVTGGGAAPSISSAANATFSNLTSWVTAVTSGNEFCFQMSSPSTFAWVNLYLDIAAN